ncbi:MAG: ABC transporter ATP-binding protein [Candidatus Gracilibacteria bacterium]|jgi:putative ABC transport system ATP-binding protein|nr:ABC transporter ATP-binding protein [Candidatus Gracilibacteria bacterium]
MIKLENVYKRYFTGNEVFETLEAVNIEILEGEFIALTGPSGSGKSTLLNIIGGLDTASEGTVRIKNKDISTFTDEELSLYRNTEIGFVFQEFCLDPFLSVLENVLLPTRFSKDKKKNTEEKAKKLLNEVGLLAKIDSKIKELSGGQKQRVAIARALINSPRILVADEPTGNLDTTTGATILDLLKELHQTHKTTLIIATHDQAIAEKAARVIKIKDGTVRSETKHTALSETKCSSLHSKSRQINLKTNTSIVEK